MLRLIAQSLVYEITSNSDRLIVIVNCYLVLLQCTKTND